MLLRDAVEQGNSALKRSTFSRAAASCAVGFRRSATRGEAWPDVDSESNRWPCGNGSVANTSRPAAARCRFSVRRRDSPRSPVRRARC
jgi:hypothetical protein